MGDAPLHQLNKLKWKGGMAKCEQNYFFCCWVAKQELNGINLSMEGGSLKVNSESLLTCEMTISVH